MTDPFETTQAVATEGLTISITVKYGPGFDAPWLVARGPRDDVADFIGLPPGSKLSDFNTRVPLVADHAHKQYGGDKTPKGR